MFNIDDIKDFTIHMFLVSTLIMTVISIMGIIFFWEKRVSVTYFIIAMLLWLEILMMSVLYIIN